MPSTKKTIHFLSSALVTTVSVGVLGFGLSTVWAKATMDCARTDVGLFNGSAQIIFSFFNGTAIRDSCPSFGDSDQFEGNVLEFFLTLIIIQFSGLRMTPPLVFVRSV